MHLLCERYCLVQRTHKVNRFLQHMCSAVVVVVGGGGGTGCNDATAASGDATAATTGVLLCGRTCVGNFWIAMAHAPCINTKSIARVLRPLIFNSTDSGQASASGHGVRGPH